MSASRRLRCSPPAYRLHKASGQAVVTISGKGRYLGAHGSQESRDAYDRYLKTWQAASRAASESIRAASAGELAASTFGDPL